MERDFIMKDLDFEVVAGPNSKQLWVYESLNDVWIDPPKEILDQIDEDSDAFDWDKKCELLGDIVFEEPDWLYETDYWYDANEFDI